MDGPKDESSKKREEDVKALKENKAESESIHTMEDVDGKLFADWEEYSKKKPKKRMGTMEADSEASTNSSVSDLESWMAIGEEEERVTWGGRFSLISPPSPSLLFNFQVRFHPLYDWECCGPGERVEVSLHGLQERGGCLPHPLLHLHVRHRHLRHPHREHHGPVLCHGHSSCLLQVRIGKNMKCV